MTSAGHPFFELGENDFTETDKPAEVDITVEQFVENFALCDGELYSMEPEMAIGLLGKLVRKFTVEQLRQIGFEHDDLGCFGLLGKKEN